MFEILENGKPAVLVGSSDWNNHQFETFEAACIYVNSWLGEYGPITIELNQSIDYNGMGDMILIHETKDLTSKDLTSKDLTSEELSMLASEADAARQGIRISTASMLAIGLLQRPEITNGQIAIDKALSLADYLISKVTGE